MGKRDDLVALYADELRTKCGIEPDMNLLTKVTIGCGPAIYDSGAAVVIVTDPTEIDAVKRNFLVKKLGLTDTPELRDAIDAIIDTYGRTDQRKYRAVVYYLLTRHFRREAVFGCA